MPSTDPTRVAHAIDEEIVDLPDRSTAAVRTVRRAWSARLRDRPGAEVLAVAEALVARQRWVAYELVEHHPGALALVDDAAVARFGAGMGSWAEVDAFGRHLAGIAWQQRQLDDATVLDWTRSPDRWWRRAALVATVPLNLRAAGGTGDTRRTLRICEPLVADRDPMVVKALSWALRQLALWDPDAVADFLAHHDADLAPRVQREVTTKLRTGRKRPGRATA